MKKIKTEPPDGEIIQVTVPGMYGIISWHDIPTSIIMAYFFLF